MTAAEQQGTGHQADGGPTNQRGATVRLVHHMHNLASLQAGDVNVILQTLAASEPPIPSLLAPAYFPRASPLFA